MYNVLYMIHMQVAPVAIVIKHSHMSTSEMDKQLVFTFKQLNLNGVQPKQ